MEGGNTTLEGTMLTGMPTVHNDLPLVSLILKWSGADTAISLEEFSSIEGLVKIGRWESPDLV